MLRGVNDKDLDWRDAGLTHRSNASPDQRRAIVRGNDDGEEHVRVDHAARQPPAAR